MLINVGVKDVQIVVEVVLKSRIFEVMDERCHSKFLNFSSYPLHRFIEISNDQMDREEGKVAEQQH